MFVPSPYHKARSNIPNCPARHIDFTLEETPKEPKIKLAFFDDYKLGVVVGDKIDDVSAVTKGIKALGPQDVIRGVIEKWSTYKGKLDAAAKKGKGKPLGKVKLRPPLPKPENIDLHGGELHGGRHAAGAGADQCLHEVASAIIGDGDTMVLPDVPANVFEGEAEIAIVIGKTATNVQAADAMNYVFGYTNFIDGSARGVVPPSNVFYQMKSRETFAPIGPYIVTADEITEPQKLQIRL